MTASWARFPPETDPLLAQSTRTDLPANREREVVEAAFVKDGLRLPSGLGGCTSPSP